MVAAAAATAVAVADTAEVAAVTAGVGVTAVSGAATNNRTFSKKGGHYGGRLFCFRKMSQDYGSLLAKVRTSSCLTKLRELFYA
jgi:hypothetical protein